MRLIRSLAAAAAAAVVLVPGRAEGQRISLTPMAGAYIPASDVYELREQAETVRVEKEATLGLGMALELGSFRAMLAYATGATVNGRGVDQDAGELGDGSVLVATGSIVLRPIPRILLLRPYLLAGGGLKWASYSFDGAGGGPSLDAEQTDPAAHIGLGTDLMLGPVGLVMEVNDFITVADGDFGPHDAFVLVGIRLAL
jgi:hypothetical protein